MNDFQKLLKINELKQKSINEINLLKSNIDKIEDDIRDNITMHYQELEKLKSDYCKIVETYSHIIKAFVIK